MDRAALLAKIVGAVLFLWTLRSIYKHVKDRREAGAQGEHEVQSVSEFILNSLLLYLWLAFCIVFSLGMIFNN